MKTVRRLIYGEVLAAVAFVLLAFLALFSFFDLIDDLSSLGLPVGQLVVFLVISVVVGVLAAVIPAIRAARLNVLDAIATE